MIIELAGRKEILVVDEQGISVYSSLSTYYAEFCPIHYYKFEDRE